VKSLEVYNFNPGTLASPTDKSIMRGLEYFQHDAHLSALSQYQVASEQAEKIKFKINTIWQSNLDVSIIHSATTFSTLLAYALTIDSNKKLTILTSSHEHFGGIRAFQNLPNHFLIIYLKDEDIANQDNFYNAIELYQPDILFLSHILYDTGWVLAVSQFGKILKKLFPESIFIVDVAQSLGLINLPEATHVDVMFGSAHKWLMGPQGIGVLWTSSFFKSRVKSIYLLMNNPDNPDDGFSIVGGRDFSSYSRMLFALDEYQNTGISIIEHKTRELSDYFWKSINVCFDKFNINSRRMESGSSQLSSSPFLVLYFQDYNPYELYKEMSNANVCVKCIIDCNVFGNKVHILRIGILYFETTERILKSVNIVENCLYSLQRRGGDDQ